MSAKGIFIVFWGIVANGLSAGLLFNQTGSFESTVPLSTAVADDFVISEKYTITGFNVWVTDSGTGAIGSIDGWMGLGWAVYDLDAGVPGSLIATGYDPAATVSSIGDVSVAGNTSEAFVVSTALDSPLLLDAGVCWLGVRDGEWNTSDNVNSDIRWLLTGGAGDSRFYVTLADEAVDPDFTRRIIAAGNFQIEGEVGTLVPEPRIYTLIIGCLGFVVVLGRRGGKFGASTIIEWLTGHLV
ncbi:hypothetical protein [Cerasicoccus frondis]|uniref:hypothetical protein n=1 Tax=Cerasicoccus frondis TaxID=490090 RepID=UPI002852C378|nr:hypothetical protein [Cerasicoccus frondis]